MMSSGKRKASVEHRTFHRISSMTYLFHHREVSNEPASHQSPESSLRFRQLCHLIGFGASHFGT